MLLLARMETIRKVPFGNRSVSLGRQGRLDYVNFGTYVPRI
jgi:hypothetical protein